MYISIFYHILLYILHMYICVCKMSLCVYICTHIYTDTLTHPCMCMHTTIHVHIHTPISIHTQNIYTHTHTHTNSQMLQKIDFWEWEESQRARFRKHTVMIMSKWGQIYPIRNGDISIPTANNIFCWPYNQHRTQVPVTMVTVDLRNWLLLLKRKSQHCL